jgi:hypothetical protein
MLFCVMCVIVLYYIVLYCIALLYPVLHCRTLPLGMGPFEINYNYNKLLKGHGCWSLGNVCCASGELTGRSHGGRTPTKCVCVRACLSLIVHIKCNSNPLHVH